MTDLVYEPNHYKGLRVKTRSATVAHDNTVEVESMPLIAALLHHHEWATGEQAYYYGNAVKYLFRAGHKGKPRLDVCKAICYLENLRDVIPAD